MAEYERRKKYRKLMMSAYRQLSNSKMTFSKDPFVLSTFGDLSSVLYKTRKSVTLNQMT
jgi:hypothetical protein